MPIALEAVCLEVNEVLAIIPGLEVATSPKGVLEECTTLADAVSYTIVVGVLCREVAMPIALELVCPEISADLEAVSEGCVAIEDDDV